MISDKLKQVVGEGAKRKRKGKGVLGDVLKTVGNAADIIPMPNVVRDVGKTVANHLVHKSGLGVKKPRKKNGWPFFHDDYIVMYISDDDLIYTNYLIKNII